MNTDGFIVLDANKPDVLPVLRDEIYELVQHHFDCSHDDPDFGLNNLHKLCGSFTAAELNQRRVSLIKDMNSKIDVGDKIFCAFENSIRSLIGHDILVQKNTNLVIQMPDDPNPSELHRDAPGNSCYELVVWVPLVDCYKTKAMYILSSGSTKAAYENLGKHGDWTAFEKEAIVASQNPKVNFGQALFFSTAVLHGSEVNKENETRVSLNIRFKNMFSPSGLKNQYQFFRTLTVSDFTKIGASLELEVLRNEQLSLDPR